MTTVQTAWIAPPKPITGRDHLRVQAPCIALYTQLLPGLTNVTDRARYFSFYSWLIWSYDQRYSDRSQNGLARVVRRADCLFALVAAHHEQELEDDNRLHGTAMVGRQTLEGVAKRIRAGERFELSMFADFEAERRYFATRLGGLGQYYFGPMRDLHLLDYVDSNRRNPIGIDKERGLPLAEAFDLGVEAELFFDILESGSIGQSELEILTPFCPCGLRSNPAERELLLDIMLARTDMWRKHEGGEWRRITMALLMDLLAQDEELPIGWLEGRLRGACYTGSLGAGRSWSILESWQQVRSGWGTYQRNEMLSIALQGLFWAVLQEIRLEHNGTIRRVEDAGPIGRDLCQTNLGLPEMSMSVAKAVQHVGATLPALDDWAAESHEIQRAWGIARSVRDQKEPQRDDLQHIATESLLLLMSLMARETDGRPYEEFGLDPNYFGHNDIHLLSLQREFSRWSNWPVSEWIEWLSTNWGIERHLHVALNKLRHQGQDTFRVRPDDDELRVVAIPPPVFTAPRLFKAERVLIDLGLVVPGDTHKLSDDGLTQLEACRG